MVSVVVSPTACRTSVAYLLEGTALGGAAARTRAIGFGAAAARLAGGAVCVGLARFAGAPPIMRVSSSAL